jgi:hypothetical protein
MAKYSSNRCTICSSSTRQLWSYVDHSSPNERTVRSSALENLTVIAPIPDVARCPLEIAAEADLVLLIDDRPQVVVNL